MKKYKIIIQEFDETLVEQNADSFDEAVNKTKDKIANDKIYLEPTSNYTQTFINYYSKELDNSLAIFLKYNPNDKTIVIINNEENDKQRVYDGCYTVRDLSDIFSSYCKNNLEEREIEAEKEIEEEREMI